MKPTLFATAILCLAFALLSPGAAYAKGKMQKPKPTPVPEKVNASGGKIAAVAGDTISVQYSKTTQNFKMTNETNITLEGTKVGSNALKKGMSVEVEASKLNPGLALSISASNK
jgi:hypothetical protein